MRIPKDKTASLEDLLRAAAREGDCYTIRRLVLAGADIESRDEHGFSALNYAAENKQINAMKTLLAAKDMKAYAEKGAMPEQFFWSQNQKKASRAKE